jgi:flagellar hook assembly protein FlgD
VNISLALGVNKFNDLSDPPLRVDYWILNGGNIKVSVYNVADVKIRSLVSISQPVGAYTVYWDGLDDRGESVASGLYLVAVIEPKRVEIKKVLVLKQ